MKQLVHLHYTTRAAVLCVRSHVDAFAATYEQVIVQANTAAINAKSILHTPASRHSPQHRAIKHHVSKEV
jgi:hypothetical protein